MNDDLKELGITPDEDMEEGDAKPGEVVDDRVATGDVGDHEDEDAKDEKEVSMEEAQALEEAAEKKTIEDEE